MAQLNLQENETVLMKAKAQLLQGFPGTTGDLYLTNKRLILIPNQLLSVGFGKRWELPLSRIRSAETKGRFQGGPFLGSAGNRVILHLHDNSKYILAFLGNIDQFYPALSAQIEKQPQSAQFESQEPEPTPPQEAGEVDNGRQPVPASAEHTPQPNGAASHLTYGARPLKDRNIALILEILPGLFGLLGFGWLYSGNTRTGILWLVGVLVWDLVAVLINVLTTGYGCCLTIPVNLVLVAISAATLNAYTKRHPETFGA